MAHPYKAEIMRQLGGRVSRGKGSPPPTTNATGAASRRGLSPPAGGPSYRGGQSTKGNISRWASYAARPKG